MRLANRYDDFESTMEGLSSGFQVRHIATQNPLCCCEDDDFDQFLRQPEIQQFDQFPITSGRGYVVGVLERSITGTLPWTHRPLDASLLTAAHQPLQTFIPTLADLPYRLVVGGDGVNAIVTKSDVQKLPVQIHVFALLTHLESLMIQRIAERVESDDEWLRCLNGDERRKLRKFQREAQKDQIDPPLIQFTSLGHKIQILRTLSPLNVKDEDELKRIGCLRNDIAHGKPYAETEDRLSQFIQTLDVIESWIAKLQENEREPR